MSTKSKLFWGAFAAELVIAGVIGWKIANAQHHPWEVQPRRKPNPLPPALPARGQRQRQGVRHATMGNVLAGTIQTKDES
jgi:hypothetical protein